MQFLSGGFVILWVITFALYYLLPSKYQWVVLAAASGLFYVIGTGRIPLGIFVTALSTYACGKALAKSLSAQKDALADCADKEKKKAVKSAFGERRKRLQILYFVLNLGILLCGKYMAVLLPFLRTHRFLSPAGDAFFSNIVMPLGVSFYTLTAIGYVVDVGREQCKAQENPLKLFLYLAYFPAITQGPFHRYEKMKAEFAREHVFDYGRLASGVQRFVWGAFKKLVIADRLGIFVSNVFDGGRPQIAGGVYAVAVVFYMLQLYADFSGYMDMALGVSETFDIVLPENFKRPYFSTSVAEFWRRWHITLGAWFKDYVMFSFIMSDAGRKLGKASKKRWPDFGKHVTALVGTMIVWIFTGLWHGRTVSYLLWGVYYGIIMCLSLVLEPRYAVWKEKLHIKAGKVWSFVCMARTWVIVFAADILIRTGSLAQAGEVYLAIPGKFGIVATLRTLTDYGLSRYAFLLLLFACALWLFVSVCEERGMDVRKRLSALPLPLRWGCYYGVALLLIITGIYGGSYDTEAFLYQSF